MFTVSYYVYTLAHATGSARIEVEHLADNVPAGEVAFGLMDAYITSRNRWDNDGFTHYVKFRFVNQVTGSEFVYRYVFSDTSRSLLLECGADYKPLLQVG